MEAMAALLGGARTIAELDRTLIRRRRPPAAAP
jgi:hypothetical protein